MQGEEITDIGKEIVEQKKIGKKWQAPIQGFCYLVPRPVLP